MGLPRKLDVLVSLFARHANTEDELTAFGPGILLGKAAPRWWRRVVVVTHVVECRIDIHLRVKPLFDPAVPHPDASLVNF